MGVPRKVPERGLTTRPGESRVEVVREERRELESRREVVRKALTDQELEDLVRAQYRRALSGDESALLWIDEHVLCSVLPRALVR